MSELTYKKIIDVEQVEILNDAATVFINDNGAMKQVSANKFGAVKTVNGVEPDENGDIAVEVPTDEHINGLIDNKMAGAGGSGGAFVVTFSKDDTGTRSVDKTFAEIENAITSGQVVLAKTTEFEGSDTWLKLDAHSGEYITFTYYMALQYYITYFAFAINADGTVGFFSQNYLTAESN